MADHAQDEALAADACAADSIDNYSVPLHVASIFIMCAVSILGFLIPLLVTSSKKNAKAKQLFIESGKAFGTGVVIATGFIHMLMEAAELLHEDCAPAVFHNYEPLPYVLCIGTIFLVQALEFFLTRALLPHDHDRVDSHHSTSLVTDSRHAGHAHGKEKLSDSEVQTINTDDAIDGPLWKPLEHDVHLGSTRPTTPCTPGCAEATAVIVIPGEPGHTQEPCATLYTEANSCGDITQEDIQQIRYVHVDHSVLGCDDDSTPEKIAKSQDDKSTNQHKHGHVHGHLHIHHHDHAAASRYVRLRRRVAVMVLEVGIAIHSIIIGLTLGVQPDGDSFNTLLAALCFHQFFEGWALSEAIRDAQFVSFKLVLLTGIIYSLTTPLGVTIGIAIHNTYNGNSPTAITLLGVLDCMSAGILIYMGLVQFMTAWFTSNEEFMRRPLWWILCVYLALAGGMAVMSVIGIWS